MSLTNTKTEHFWQKVIPHKHHNQNEVIYNTINIKILDFGADFPKFILKIFSKNTHYDILKLDLADLSDGGI